jgi:uncharacterized protein YbjT (DUF2867 family)
VDRIPYFYYRAKLEAEALVEASGLPWTILRATQFHELVYRFLQAAARLPILLVPRGWRDQLPGRVARGFRSGGHLAPDHATGTRTWEQFLARRGPGNPTGCPGGSGEAGGTGLT